MILADSLGALKSRRCSRPLEKLEALKSPRLLVWAARLEIFGRAALVSGAVYRVINLSLTLCTAARRSA